MCKNSKLSNKEEPEKLFFKFSSSFIALYQLYNPLQNTTCQQIQHSVFILALPYIPTNIQRTDYKSRRTTILIYLKVVKLKSREC